MIELVRGEEYLGGGIEKIAQSFEEIKKYFNRIKRRNSGIFKILRRKLTREEIVSLRNSYDNLQGLTCYGGIVLRSHKAKGEQVDDMLIIDIDRFKFQILEYLSNFK